MDIQSIIYSAISLLATTLGAMTGMGGGVIIKPVMDFLGDFDVASINILSSITVFAMAIVSTASQVRSEPNFSIKSASLLGVGAVLGGVAGNEALFLLIRLLHSEALVTMIQNIIMVVIILFAFFYMKNKHRIRGFSFEGFIYALLIGLLLGGISTFLGIGGGPINVALLMFIVGNDTKTAMTNSLVIILFSQAARLVTVAVTTGFGSFDLTILPYMLVAAVAGGFLGSFFHNKMSESAAGLSFNILQVVVLLICVYNIIVSLGIFQ